MSSFVCIMDTCNSALTAHSNQNILIIDSVLQESGIKEIPVKLGDDDEYNLPEKIAYYPQSGGQFILERNGRDNCFKLFFYQTDGKLFWGKELSIPQNTNRILTEIIDWDSRWDSKHKELILTARYEVQKENQNSFDYQIVQSKWVVENNDLKLVDEKFLDTPPQIRSQFILAYPITTISNKENCTLYSCTVVYKGKYFCMVSKSLEDQNFSEYKSAIRQLILTVDLEQRALSEMKGMKIAYVK